MYNKDYVKAIKYMHEENIFSYPEGHQLHESNIHAYTDWLQEHGKDTYSDFIRQQNLDHPVEHHDLDIVTERLAHPDIGPTLKLVKHAYENDTPVMTKHAKTIWINHPHKQSNKLITYSKTFKSENEMMDNYNKLKGEGLLPL